MTYYWHVHHDIFCEEATEPIENRIQFIKNHKPEKQIETRLKLLRIVKNQEAVKEIFSEYEKIEQPAWDEYLKIEQSAWKEYLKIERPALEAYEKIERSAWKEYEKIQQSAREKYLKIRRSAMKRRNQKLEELHKIECFPDCPWNGKTIFPEKED